MTLCIAIGRIAGGGGLGQGAGGAAEGREGKGRKGQVIDGREVETWRLDESPLLRERYMQSGTEDEQQTWLVAWEDC